MKTSNLRSSFILLAAAVIWGTAFVFQNMGAENLLPFAFNAYRYTLGCFVLIPVILIKKKKQKLFLETGKKGAVIGGICCGSCLFLASALQQAAMADTSAGKAGFITSFYLVLVPIFGLFLKKKTSVTVWIAIIPAMIGIFCLCMKGSFSLSPSDGSLLMCAAVFACHILSVDHFVSGTDGVLLSCIQFGVCAGLSYISMFIFEGIPQTADLSAAVIPVLYTGIMSCGVAYTFQVIGQKDVTPAAASIILSLEACISVLAGLLILGQMLDAWEIVGCILMFIAVLLTFVRPKEKTTRSL